MSSIDKDAVTTGTIARMALTFGAMAISAALVGLMLLVINRLDDHGQRLARIEGIVSAMSTAKDQHAAR